MGEWTWTAPTLPSGSAWEQEVTMSYSTQNRFGLGGSKAIARLSGKKYAIKLFFFAGGATRGYTYAPPDNFKLYIYKNGTQESVYTKSWGSSVAAGTEYTIYYISEADEGTTIKTTIGNDYSSSVSTSATSTVPAELGGFFVNVNGTWKNAVPWVKVNGVWKQGTPFVKVNGEWKD